MELTSTIVANNTNTDINADVTATYSLIEDITDTNFLAGSNNNVIGSDPMLAPLADNGGSTQTHALLAGSPAIDAGINSTPSLDYDQRGSGFDRDVDGVDIGDDYEYINLE